MPFPAYGCEWVSLPGGVLLLVMLTNELTPAEARMLQFLRQTGYDTMYESIHGTLAAGMVNFLEDDGPTGQALSGCKTVQHWFFMLQFLREIHEVKCNKIDHH